MPAITIVSTSSGQMASKPPQRRKSIPAVPYSCADCLACAKGSGRISEAMAQEIFPCCSSQTGRYPWSVPMSAKRLPKGTISARSCNLGCSCSCFCSIISPAPASSNQNAYSFRRMRSAGISAYSALLLASSLTSSNSLSTSTP